MIAMDFGAIKDFTLRLFFTGLIILLAFLLQNGLFSGILYFGTIPNLLLIVTVIYGFLEGRHTGIWVGVVCGLAMDLYVGDMMGEYLFFYLYAGFLAGLFSRFFYPDQLILPTALCGGFDLLFGLYEFFLHSVLQNQTNLLPYLMRIMLPEAVSTMVCAIVFFRLILFVHDRRIEAEQRRARRFV